MCSPNSKEKTFLSHYLKGAFFVECVRIALASASAYTKSMKIRTVISVIVVIIILFLARSIFSDHNSKKIIGACILAQTQTSSIEEAKQICVDKFK